MKITVREALSSKLQNRMKLKQLDQFIKELPALGGELGLTVSELQNEGLAFGWGNATKEDQEKFAPSVYKDFDDYITWTIKTEDGEYYTLAKFKPETWDLSLEDLKNLFEMLDDSFSKHI